MGANEKRIAELRSRLAADLPLAGQACTALDEAVEFATLEGQSIGEALREFFGEPMFRDAWAGAQLRLREIVFAGGTVTLPRLPVLPQAAARLMRTSVETVSASELDSIAREDPVLAGRLLAAANSARFGSGQQIVSPREAILRIGIPEARKVLIAGCFSGLFASRDLRDLWEHSQHVAQMAFDLAALAEVDAELAFVAGLLHDVGRLGLLGAAGAQRIAEREWCEAGFPLAYAETLVFGLDHAEIGANMLRAWQVPEAIIEAVELHHRPECAKTALAGVLALADLLASRAANRVAEDLWAGLRESCAMQAAGIAPGALKTFLAGRNTKTLCA